MTMEEIRWKREQPCEPVTAMPDKWDRLIDDRLEDLRKAQKVRLYVFGILSAVLLCSSLGLVYVAVVVEARDFFVRFALPFFLWLLPGCYLAWRFFTDLRDYRRDWKGWKTTKTLKI